MWPATHWPGQVRTLWKAGTGAFSVFMRGFKSYIFMG
jgi:hypothetical protein